MMKKILGFLIVLVTLLFASSQILAFTKTTEVSYSETTNDKYASTPSPAFMDFKTYTNEDYKFFIDYPITGKDLNGRQIECGKYINQNPNDSGEEMSIDGLLNIRVLDWDESIGQFLIESSAENKYFVSEIVDSGAQQALLLNELKNEWTGEENPPLHDVLGIYKRDGKLFLTLKASDGTEGCTQDKNFKVENHLRFY